MVSRGCPIRRHGDAACNKRPELAIRNPDFEYVPSELAGLVGDAFSIRRNRRRCKAACADADRAAGSIRSVNDRERGPITGAVPHRYGQVAVVRKPAWRGQHTSPGDELSRRTGRIRHDHDGSYAVDSQPRTVGRETQSAIGGALPQLFRLTALQGPDPQLAVAVESQCLAIRMKSGGSDSLVYFLRAAAGGRDGPQTATGNVINAGTIGRPERGRTILISLSELYGIRRSGRLREALHDAMNAPGVSDALAIRRPLRRIFLGLRPGDRRKLVRR
jgi:hypothetical protein